MRPSLLFKEDLSKADKFSNELKGLDRFNEFMLYAMRITYRKNFKNV